MITDSRIPWHYPDAPMAISEAMLATLDKEPAGTWYAQPKLDGHRHLMQRHPDTHRWQHWSKLGNTVTLEPALNACVERMRMPSGVLLDTELVGPRHKGMSHRLYLFDVLTFPNGEWINLPYYRRLDMLRALADVAEIGPYTAPVSWLDPFTILSLNEQYEQEKQNPLSEGLVIRHRNQINVGSLSGQAQSHLFLKIKFKRA